MPKPVLVGRAPRRGGGPRVCEMRTSVEGQITELCRDLAIEVKRMRRLESQADELRLAILEWVGHSERPTGTSAGSEPGH
jgi:hypothetical protein